MRRARLGPDAVHLQAVVVSERAIGSNLHVPGVQA
jgi:hypothetical protein